MTLKEQTLAHHDRMITWVEKQDKNEKVNIKLMEEAIEEGWYSEHCPLCNKYQSFLCTGCPVANTGHAYCKNTPWEEMDESRTWGEFLIYAKAERKFLASLDYK